MVSEALDDGRITPNEAGAIAKACATVQAATVTIARPQAMNALDLTAEARLRAIWCEIEARDDVRVVVLAAEGDRAFCAGADLKNPSGSGLEYWAAACDGGFGGIASRETLDVPVVARVNGVALQAAPLKLAA